MSFDVKLELDAKITDTVTAEQYVGKNAKDTAVRAKYSAQGFSIANGTVDKKLDINDMSLVKDIILVCDQEITVKFNGLTTYQITNEQQTSTAKDRVSTDAIIDSVQGVWLGTDPGHTGTNYYTGGSFNIREIELGTELPNQNTDVLIDYTTSAAISFKEKLIIQSSSIKSIYVTNNSGNTANLYIILAGD